MSVNDAAENDVVVSNNIVDVHPVYEELFQDYKKYFETTDIPVKEIYEKIGVTGRGGDYKYIRKRCKQEGLKTSSRLGKFIKNNDVNKTPMKYGHLQYSVEVYEMADKSSELLNKMFNERNVKEATRKGYIASFHKYCDYTCGKYVDLQDMLDTYTKEEDDRIPLRDRVLKQDLLGFRDYLLSSGENNNLQSSKSVNTYFSKIKSIFNHFGIEMPRLPQVKMDKGYVSNFNDLPDKHMLMRACDQSTLDMKAVILFMSSSGSAKAEALSITVKMFLEGCSEYLNEIPTENNIYETLYKLSDMHNIVPLIYLRRIKTDKWYYTCCSPEASYIIIEYLKTRDNLKWDDKIFDFTSSLLLVRFQEINDNNNWGYVGPYRRFRSHALRKFMASNIGLPRDQVDSLQGRAKDEIQEAYFKQDPKQLKKIYMDVMHRLMIYNNWGYGTTPEELKYNSESNFNKQNNNSEDIIDICSIPIEEVDIKKSINKSVEVIDSVDDNDSTPNISNNNIIANNGVIGNMPLINSGFSVAKELLMYSELLEKGLLSVNEFNKLKEKLLLGVLR